MLRRLRRCCGLACCEFFVAVALSVSSVGEGDKEAEVEEEEEEAATTAEGGLGAPSILFVSVSVPFNEEIEGGTSLKAAFKRAEGEADDEEGDEVLFSEEATKEGRVASLSPLLPCRPPHHPFCSNCL